MNSQISSEDVSNIEDEKQESEKRKIHHASYEKKIDKIGNCQEWN